MSNAFASGSALGSLVRDYTEEELAESCSSSSSESSGSEVEIEKVQPSASAGGGGGAAGSGGELRLHTHTHTYTTATRHKHTPTAYSRPRSSTMSNAFASGSALGSLVRDYTEEELAESCSSSSSESSGSEVEIEKVQPSASAGGGGGAAGSGGGRAHQHQHRNPASQLKQASRDSFPNQPSPHSSGRQRRRGPSSVRKMLLLQLPILQHQREQLTSTRREL